MKKITLIFILLASSVISSGGNVINVPADYTTIQAGINIAVEGDTVLVAAGTYTGDGNKDLNFNGKAITVLSANGAETTIIDCEGLGRGIKFDSNEDSTSIFKGFTIRYGFEEKGSGIYCIESPTIEDCIVVLNFAIEEGGGIWHGSVSPGPHISNCIISGNIRGGINCSGRPIIENCTITSNILASLGGGISCVYSEPLITGCLISGNDAGSGGGIYFKYGREETIVEKCMIANNSASDGGGITIGENSQPNFINCMIVNNYADNFGGGVYLLDYDSIDATMTNCTLSGNIADRQNGGGIYDDGWRALTVKNSIFWDNSPDEIVNDYLDVSYSIVKGGYPGEGNIDSNPYFLDPDAEDFRIASFSPCIDAGNSDGAPADDYEGDARPWGNGYDIGADEYAHSGALLDLFPKSFDLISRYPELILDDESFYIVNAGTEDLGITISGDDAQWIEIDGVSSDTLAVAEWVKVNLNFSVVGLVQGSYTDTITIVSNDPIQPLIEVPVLLSIYSNGVIRVPDHIRTIQQAIDVSEHGDTVLVADGTFSGTGNREIDFNGKEITLKSENGYEFTTLDCEYAGGGISFQTGETEATTLEGFSIVNGVRKEGGGIYCYESYPNIIGCRISGCIALYGGGLRLYQSQSPSNITECQILGNIASYGGGIFYAAFPYIRNCIIANNAAEEGGGVMGGGQGTILNCGVYNNFAWTYGGGIYINDSSIINCTISNNAAQKGGGGIYCYYSAPIIINSILWNDTPDEIYLASSAEPDVEYSDIEGGWEGEGNIDLDPEFVDSDSLDFQLLDGSPCIDAGDPTFDVPPGGGRRIDMGAYEYWFGWYIKKYNSTN